MKTLAIEYWPLEKLTPYARELRRHDEATVARMADLLRAFGMRLPLLVDGDGWIIDGKLRLKAITTLAEAERQRLGLTQLPVIPTDDLSPEEVRALRLALDRSAAWALWDEEALAQELRELDELDLDLSLTGLDLEEIDDLLGAAGEIGFPVLPDGDKNPFQQMTFTLHDQQADQVKRALSAAKAMGPFTNSLNKNSNGNALARVCGRFLAQHA